MKSDLYYYIAALPTLGGLGTAPPMGSAYVLEHVSESAARAELVGALFLEDDLFQREAFLAGETTEVDPVVLTVHQTRNESPLPEYLAPAEDRPSGPVAVDALWESYFRHVAEVARRQGSRFLAAWVGHEVALRNALAAARAKRLGLEEAGFLVARDLEQTGEDFGNLLSEWSAAATPLEGFRLLLQARWDWLEGHDAWFTFRDDELAVYAARLMLLHQWRRASAEAATSARGAADTSLPPERTSE